VVAKGFPKTERRSIRPGGGRTCWAHSLFTRINIQLNFRKYQIEELMNVDRIGGSARLGQSGGSAAAMDKSNPLSTAGHRRDCGQRAESVGQARTE
jgi:hypothetical protein